MLKISPYRLDLQFIITIHVSRLNSSFKKLEIVKLDFKVIQLCAVSKRYQEITGHRKIAKDRTGQ